MIKTSDDIFIFLQDSLKKALNGHLKSDRHFYQEEFNVGNSWLVSISIPDAPDAPGLFKSVDGENLAAIMLFNEYFNNHDEEKLKNFIGPAPMIKKPASNITDHDLKLFSEEAWKYLETSNMKFRLVPIKNSIGEKDMTIAWPN